MERNKNISRFYIKVEELSVIYRLYNSKLEEYKKYDKLIVKENISEDIKKSLVKFDYKQPTNKQLAKHVDFLMKSYLIYLYSGKLLLIKILFH